MQLAGRASWEAVSTLLGGGQRVGAVVAPVACMAPAEAEPAVALTAALVGARHLQYLVAGRAPPAIDDAWAPAGPSSTPQAGRLSRKLLAHWSLRALEQASLTHVGGLGGPGQHLLAPPKPAAPRRSHQPPRRHAAQPLCKCMRHRHTTPAGAVSALAACVCNTDRAGVIPMYM